MDIPDRFNQLFGELVLIQAPAGSIIQSIDASQALVSNLFCILLVYQFFGTFYYCNSRRFPVL